MDTRTPRARFLGVALLAAALATMSAPSQALAQDMPEVGPEKLATYVKVHVAINDLRDEMHGEMGRVHDEQGRERIRADTDEKIAKIHTDLGMSEEEYDQITLIVSFDSELRAQFEKLLAEAISSGT